MPNSINIRPKLCLCDGVCICQFSMGRRYGNQPWNSDNLFLVEAGHELKKNIWIFISFGASFWQFSIATKIRLLCVPYGAVMLAYLHMRNLFYCWFFAVFIKLNVIPSHFFIRFFQILNLFYFALDIVYGHILDISL